MYLIIRLVMRYGFINRLIFVLLDQQMRYRYRHMIVYAADMNEYNKKLFQTYTLTNLTSLLHLVTKKMRLVGLYSYI